jgi:hypothetical protein
MKKRIGTFVAVLAILTGTTYAGVALAANPAADLDQCANDPAPSPRTDGCNTSASQWVNGNLNASKSLYFEGDTIPYRMRFTNLAGLNTVVHHVIIEWDTTKGGKHAIDYLDDVDESVNGTPAINPCLGVSTCNPASFSTTNGSIPADPQVTAGATVPPAINTGAFRIYGGSITSLTSPTKVGNVTCTNANTGGSYCYSSGSGFTGDKSAAIQVNFIASVASPVLAWGGHIATRANWGQGNSAGAVSGSPYHMRLIDLDGSGGNQDRSLSADAVVLPGSITIIKDAVANSLQDFSFADTGGLTPTSFILDDDSGVTGADGTRSNTQAFNAITSFTTYTFTETAVSHWALSLTTPPCTVTSPNSGSSTGNATTGVVTVNLKEGENYTCTFTNTHQQNTPGITTTLSATTGNIGDTVHDGSTLSGATSDAAGTVKYRVYSTTTACNAGTYDTPGGTDAGSVTVAAGVIPDSNGVQFNDAGTYYWRAFYSGDANNDPASSGCSEEILVISPNTTHLSTTTNITSGSIGAELTDSAALTGATSNAGGTISFYLFAPGATCMDTGTITGYAYSATGVPVTSNGTYSSADATATTGSNTATVAGTYTWSAVYTDGANNVSSHSSCGSEDVVIAPNGPTITTTLSAETGNIGDTVHDGSTLHGATDDAGGTVKYAVYSSATDCEAGTYDSPGGTSAGSKTVVAGVVPDSDGVQFTDAGTYYWRAFYGGDSNNTGNSSGCDEEVLVIGPNHPTLTTDTDPDSGNIGDTLTDSATLTGAASGTGTITFYLFGPDTTCNADGTGAVYSSVITGVTADGTVYSKDGTESGDNTATIAGTYTWLATYSDGANNVATDSGCGSEDVVISPNTPTVSTLLSDLGPITIGTTVHDSATLNDATSDASGTISYALYSDDTCSTLVADLTPDPSAVTNGSAPDSTSYTFNNAGTFYFQATYSGDSNNTGPVSSECTSEELVVSPNMPDIATQPTLNVRDAVTISNLASVTTYGNLTVKLVNGTDCTGETLQTFVWYGHDRPDGGNDFTGNGTYTTEFVTVNKDAELHWCTEYEGDANNAARPFADDDEVVTVDFKDASIWAAAGFGLSLPIMLWSAWRRRRRDAEI